MDADPIRVLVVDDQDLVRSGFKMILNTYEGIEVRDLATWLTASE